MFKFELLKSDSELFIKNVAKDICDELNEL